MTDYPAWTYEFAEELLLDLTSSLDDPLDEVWKTEGLFEPLENDEGTHGTMQHAPVPFTYAPDYVHLFSGTYPAPRDFGAATIPVFDRDWFGHIIINPATLDLGNLLAGQTREIEVANTYTDEDREWQAFSILIPSGVTATNVPAFPYSIPPFGNYVIEITVSGVGTPVVDGDLEFTFDIGSLLYTHITATRLIIAPFVPQAGIKEKLAWATDIIESYDGTEQRSALRQTPRQVLQYTFTLEEGDDTQRMEGLLFDWLPRVWGVPIWFEEQRLELDLASGATLIPVDTTISDYRVGSLVMIYESPTKFEAYEILTVNTDSVEIDGTTSETFYAGQASVMPVRQAFAKSTASTQRAPSGYEIVNMEFTTLDNAYLGDIDGLTLYREKVVLEDPNYIESSQWKRDWERPVVVIDTVSGRVYQTSRTDRSRAHMTKRWEPATRAEVFQIRKMLHYFRGSQITFWLPTFRNDLTLSDTIASNATTMRVRANGYSSFIAARRPLTDVQITLTNGNVYRVQVVGADSDGDEDVLTFSPALGAFTVDPNQVERMEYLQLVRIEDDSAVLTHLRSGEAVIEIDVVSPIDAV